MSTVSSDVIFESLSPKAQKRVEEKAKKEIAQYRALQTLRKELGLTQKQVAEAMDLAQNNISELESRSDIMFSTLKTYLDALGCKMHIVVTKPDNTETKIPNLIS